MGNSESDSLSCNPENHDLGWMMGNDQWPVFNGDGFMDYRQDLNVLNSLMMKEWIMEVVKQ